MEIVYKIRSADGLFSRGGRWIRFNKRGKVWKRKRDLVLHLSQLDNDDLKQYAARGAEIVEYTVVEQQVSACSIQTYWAQTQVTKVEKELARQKRLEDYKRDQRKQQYEQLRKEFGNE